MANIGECRDIANADLYDLGELLKQKFTEFSEIPSYLLSEAYIDFKARKNEPIDLKSKLTVVSLTAIDKDFVEYMNDYKYV